MKRVDLLFGHDDDWRIQIHLHIDGLVSLESVLESGSSLVTKAFQCLPGNILNEISMG